MNIVEHIGRLLFKYDCVIVPDFGGFIANYRSANIKSDSHVFSPPAKTIVFNSTLNSNDGLLVNYISTCENISYSDARIEIANFVNFLKTDLNNNKTVVFEGIGNFAKQSENIVFTPDNTINRLIEAFGLPMLQMPIDYNEFTKPIFSIPSSGKGNIVKKVLVTIPVVLVLALLPLKMSKIPFSTSTTSFYSQSNSTSNLLNNPSSLSDVIDKLTDTKYALYYSESKPNKTNIEKSISIDTIINQSEVAIKSEKKEIAVKENLPSETITTAKQNKKYFIIAGSFVEMSRVNVFNKELVSKNFSPELVKRDGKLRVAVGSFITSEEANKALNEFRAQHPEYPVWLLSI
ncbi:MAG: HU-CCDC81 and SPOR domain-containing protein [Bacteroidia bacterium]|nr:HU-CCDC81 and SPOR domain-containing protein [Bacteroidia bacterium]